MSCRDTEGGHRAFGCEPEIDAGKNRGIVRASVFQAVTSVNLGTDGYVPEVLRKRPDPLSELPFLHAEGQAERAGESDTMSMVLRSVWRVADGWPAATTTHS